jgi:glutaminase
MTALHEGLPFDEGTASSMVSTGELPEIDQVTDAVTEAYERYRPIEHGAVADYIPALASAAPELFGICVVGARGRFFEIGDVERSFSIQSVSKPFVFALVCEAIGGEPARQRLGVNSTGFPFNSLMAVELNEERTMNPLVNAGAIATTSLVPGSTAAEKWESVRGGLSRFAGRDLTMSNDVYESESATNLRNQGIAHLLASYQRLYFDPDEATDVYTRQCSLDVTVHDLAVMASTLANGGVNPMTGVRVVGTGVCRRVLAAMATAGGLAVRDRDAGQERCQRRHRDRLTGQGRPGDLLASPRCRRQQRAWPARHEVPVRAPRAQPLRLDGSTWRSSW